MALSKDVKESIRARLQSDYAFRYALLSEAVEGMLTNDLVTAKSVLHDYIDATIGFRELAARSGLSQRTLHWMFSRTGNPRADQLFKVLATLQESQGVQLAVNAA